MQRSRPAKGEVTIIVFPDPSKHAQRTSETFVVTREAIRKRSTQYPSRHRRHRRSQVQPFPKIPAPVP